MDYDERRNVLLAIRDQLRLQRGAPSADPAAPGAWTPQQYWQAFDYLFMQSSGSFGGASGSGRHHSGGGGEPATDDLLFFVNQAPAAAAGGGATAPRPAPADAYFVRRKAKRLPEELQLSGAAFDKVDWAATVLLNIVLQSQYQLTVVTCGREALPFVAEGRTWSPNMATVTKPVYSSTTVTAVNLDESRAGDAQPVPCYPDICFAVDNFGDAFETMVLQELDNCYCVVLHALLDASAPTSSAAQHGGTGTAAASLPPYADLGSLAARLSSKAAAAGGGGAGSPRGGGATGLPDTARLAERLQQAGLGGSPRAPAPAGAAAAGDAQQQRGHSLPGIVTSRGGGGVSEAGAAAAGASPAAAAPASTSGSAPASPGWQIGTRKRTLFAGYVSFGQILDFMANGRRSSGLGGLFGGGGGTTQKDKVVMTGPGGTGRAEVAVTKLDAAPPRASSEQAAAAEQGQAAEGAQSGGRSGGGGLLRAARQLASGLSKAISEGPGSGARCNMQCALMQLRLPTSYLAQELLEAM